MLRGQVVSLGDVSLGGAAGESCDPLDSLSNETSKKGLEKEPAKGAVLWYHLQAIFAG